MENECTLHNLASLPSLYKKLSKLAKSWRSSDKNNFAQMFWDTVYILTK